jgi:hypothetical protein
VGAKWHQNVNRLRKFPESIRESETCQRISTATVKKKVELRDIANLRQML